MIAMMRSILILFFVFSFAVLQAQSTDAPFCQSKYYTDAYNELASMLVGSSALNFKRAVFLSESAYYKSALNYTEFCQKIDAIELKLKQLIEDKGLASFKTGGYYAVYSYMAEPSKYNDNETYKYDFDDFLGEKSWTSMFVSKLLDTKVGNCHSLPFLYKILADELGLDAYVASAPNHVYIKHVDEKGKWVNVELTNPGFPSDGHIISSTGITVDAIKNGVYMQPLSLKKSVALCLYDLAMSYWNQYGYDDFFISCCNTVLQYYPEAVFALMAKSNALQAQYMHLRYNEKSKDVEYLNKIADQINEAHARMDALGYAEMPKALYEKWQKDLAAETARQKQVTNSKK